ncbi:MAG: adenylyltransferase/cytidyltransferase family protein [Chloroflexi bacterium]|nr:adenylyltransferase/cytidyltransferase family protein [Chloroflexota bacterium]
MKPTNQPQSRSMTALEELVQLREQWRTRGLRVVFTNGIFDLLHVGHLQYLEAARALGDLLIVGLNSDSSTRQLKGPKRPLIPESERSTLLLGLRPVDYVTLFEDRTAERLVATLQPDVYVKGGDYSLSAGDQTSGSTTSKVLPEARIVQGYGGQVELINYLAGHSTTELIERIVERYAD